MTRRATSIPKPEKAPAGEPVKAKGWQRRSRAAGETDPSPSAGAAHSTTQGGAQENAPGGSRASADAQSQAGTAPSHSGASASTRVTGAGPADNRGPGPLSPTSSSAPPRLRVNASAPSSPRDLMLPYQRAFDADRSRFKAWLASRQIGKSFTVTHEPVVTCYEADLDRKKIDWVMLSAGERQALELLDKAKQWTEAYKLAISDYTEERDGGSEALLKAATITWPNGSRIIALPANPATARGYSANLVLDEFAFHEDSDGIWRAVYPIITNPLRGQLRMRVVSTANGQGNKFYEIVTSNKRFTVHKTTIHDAVAQGLPVDIDELREGLADPEGWAQEYECYFLDSSAVLLPYDIIALCEDPLASTLQAPEYWQARGGAPVDGGIDFGRKRNLTVGWFAEKVADLQITKEVVELQNVSTAAQVEALSPRIARCRRVCLDYTGPGVGLGDLLVDRFGEWNPEKHKFGKVELCTMTNALKVDVFSKLRMAFDRRSWRIPVNRIIREDLHSIHRVTTTAGNVTYRAPLTEDSHADRCTALALCTRAGSFTAGVLTDVRGIRTGKNLHTRPTYRPRRLRV